MQRYQFHKCMLPAGRLAHIYKINPNIFEICIAAELAHNEHLPESKQLKLAILQQKTSLIDCIHCKLPDFIK